MGFTHNSIGSFLSGAFLMAALIATGSSTALASVGCEQLDEQAVSAPYIYSLERCTFGSEKVESHTSSQGEPDLCAQPNFTRYECNQKFSKRVMSNKRKVALRCLSKTVVCAKSS